jgi:hypothetical protein
VTIDQGELILEILRKIQLEQSEARKDRHDMKSRLSSSAANEASILSLIGTMAQQLAALNDRVDHIDERLHRMEQRMGRVDA